ncbi:MAG: DUF4258 domain-containing protein [Methanobrevibacter sp.]|uniref:DUF4258 domain-containing protein n=1 Tax=Methanobrevibacter sp. TaxID=66852 RepID=UPI002E7A6F20|nr:DUF4258 domain-containing protein [Methanobrevibacter sp.]MEE0935174.1 DUF4258 domain-containing protein [Methanobrevibacter sp.]
MEYYVEDTIDVLKNIKTNPYGIKDSYHALERANKRSIDLNKVNNCLYNGLLVGIEKSYNENSIFQLLYIHTKNDDLAIVINILNKEEIEIITLIEKNIQKRKHYAN